MFRSWGNARPSFPNAAHDDMADMMSQAAWLLPANWPTVAVWPVRLQGPPESCAERIADVIADSVCTGNRFSSHWRLRSCCYWLG